MVTEVSNENVCHLLKTVIESYHHCLNKLISVVSL